MSKLGCVLVNSGNFAMYRAAVVREGIPSYENEFFLGHPVQFSDDTLLTLFAKLRGRTVQQSTSFAFTVVPSNVSHHLRQQLRWVRGATLRSIWHFRYLPLRGLAYWEHLVAWVNFMLISVALTMLVIVGPIFGGAAVTPLLAALALLTCFAVNLKYLTIARNDQGLGFQIGTLMLAPVMALWTVCVLRPLRIFSILTCYRTGWGTRAKVEVEL
jgi:hyaluronan synthase